MEAIELKDYTAIARHIVFTVTGLTARHADYDDLVQEALMGILHASRAGVVPEKREAYALTAAKHAIIDFQRSRYRRRAIPLGDHDMPDSPVNALTTCEAGEAWVVIARVGTDRERELAGMIFRDGKRYREAGVALGLSKATVVRTIGKLFAKVRLEANRQVGFNVVVSSTIQEEAII